MERFRTKMSSPFVIKKKKKKGAVTIIRWSYRPALFLGFRLIVRTSTITMLTKVTRGPEAFFKNDSLLVQK